MSLKSTLAPRADFWRNQKVRKASKVWTTRALEQDSPPKAPAPKQIKRRVDARVFWKRQPPWAVDPVSDDL